MFSHARWSGSTGLCVWIPFCDGVKLYWGSLQGAGSVQEDNAEQTDVNASSA